jgi:hypothetical protein
VNSTELRGYLTGLILGDAYIDHGVQNRALRLRSINKDFVEKLYEDISSVTNFKIFINEHQGYVKDGVNHQDNWELYIKAHPYFSKIYHYFYDDYSSRYISNWALKYLNMQGLANWYMSDGYVTLVGRESNDISNRRVEFCTDRYGEVGAERVATYFSSLGYEARSFRRGQVYRVRLALRTAQNFLVDVSQYIVPSMQYKLYLAYDYRPSWMTDAYYNLMQNIKNSAYPRIFTGDEIVQ